MDKEFDLLKIINTYIDYLQYIRDNVAEEIENDYIHIKCIPESIEWALVRHYNDYPKNSRKRKNNE